MPRYYAQNPFALADLVAGRATDWSQLSPVERLVRISSTLGLKDWRDLYAPLPTDSLLTALSTLPNGFRFATLDDAIARFTGPLAELRDNNRGLLEKLLPAIAPIGQRVLLELRGSIDSSAINGASADRLVNDGGGGNRPSPPPAGGVAPVPGPVAAAGVAGPPRLWPPPGSARRSPFSTRSRASATPAQR